MADWRDCRLGDLLHIKPGFAFLGEHFADAGTHIVLTPGNFLEEGGFKEKSDKATWDSGPTPDDYVLNEGDLIVAMTRQAEGLLGSSALIPRSGVYPEHPLALILWRDFLGQGGLRAVSSCSLATIHHETGEHSDGNEHPRHPWRRPHRGGYGLGLPDRDPKGRVPRRRPLYLASYARVATILGGQSPEQPPVGCAAAHRNRAVPGPQDLP
jgi:hypothetical protein